jgi:hypothetical protein
MREVIGEHRITSLRIEQHRSESGLQVSTFALTIVVKLRRHPEDITTAWIARDKPLDQLSRDKWSHIRMIEQRIELRSSIQPGHRHWLAPVTPLTILFDFVS